PAVHNPYQSTLAEQYVQQLDPGFDRFSLSRPIRVHVLLIRSCVRPPSLPHSLFPSKVPDHCKCIARHNRNVPRLYGRDIVSAFPPSTSIHIRVLLVSKGSCDHLKLLMTSGCALTSFRLPFDTCLF